MTEENRRLAIAEDLEQAELAFEAAVVLRDRRLYKDALSRLYYALFHSLVALLLTKGIEPRRHRSLSHLLTEHFDDVLTGDEIAFAKRMATTRDHADYERGWTPPSELIAESFAAVDALRGRVREHLTATGWIST